MLTVVAGPMYRHGHRLLVGAFGNVGFRIDWNPHDNAGPTYLPTVQFSWADRLAWFEVPKDTTRWCRLTVSPDALPVPTAILSHRAFKKQNPDMANFTPLEMPVLAEGATWNDLFAIAKMVAAGKCSKHVLAGWIEDNMPEPWSLLVSPNPVDFFRAVCPLPLSESKRG